MNLDAILERPALVLNRNWAPVRVAPVREVLGLVARGSALILEPGTYQTHNLSTWDAVSRARDHVSESLIHSARLALLPPELVLLTTYDGLGTRSVIFSRKNLFKRDHFTCQYCGTQPGPEELTVDHVVPRSRGGLSSWENCVLACVDCNKRKADKPPEKAGLKLRKMPVKPSWRTLTRVSLRQRRESWEAFLSRAYWEVELEP